MTFKIIHQKTGWYTWHVVSNKLQSEQCLQSAVPDEEVNIGFCCLRKLIIYRFLSHNLMELLSQWNMKSGEITELIKISLSIKITDKHCIH